MNTALQPECRVSTTDMLFDQMLERIQSGQWSPGTMIPSERSLIEEFGVSRLALREALSRLRALGILEIRHGKGSTVRRMDIGLLGRLFPLMVSLEGEQSFQHIFEVRIGLESRTAYLAAQRRSDADLLVLEDLLEQFRRCTTALDESVEVDLRFHIEIARATGNPLFPLMLQAVSGFVTYVQTLSCRDNPTTRERALHYHESILLAIRQKDAEHARAEMEAHLRASAARILSSGVLGNHDRTAPLPTL